MDTLDAMRVFVAVVERNGFSAAAQALDMSTAGVTRQIAALESACPRACSTAPRAG